MSDIVPTRKRSQRNSGRQGLETRGRQKPVDLYPGINDLADVLEALPVDIVRYFTLLREINAKCVSAAPKLTEMIKLFLSIPVSQVHLPPEPTEEQIKKSEEINRGREELLAQIRGLIRELMPCLEEKMHVASVATDAIARHLSRMDYDYDIIREGEIPEMVQYGPKEHPAYKPENKAPEKSAPAARSEVRREAMAAKKAAAAAVHDSGTEHGRSATPGTGRGIRGGSSTNGNGSDSGRSRGKHNNDGGKVSKEATPSGAGTKRRKVFHSNNHPTLNNNYATAVSASLSKHETEDNVMLNSPVTSQQNFETNNDPDRPLTPQKKRQPPKKTTE